MRAEGLATSASHTPSFLQNSASIEFSAPQMGQCLAGAAAAVALLDTAPHFGQDLAKSAISEFQVGQSIVPLLFSHSGVALNGKQHQNHANQGDQNCRGHKSATEVEELHLGRFFPHFRLLVLLLL